MKYWYDTEFIDDGFTIELISIGIVAEDGRQYYAVNADMGEERVVQSTWLRDNVWPHLPTIEFPAPLRRMVHNSSFGRLDRSHEDVKSKSRIANEVREFLLHSVESDDDGLELWADYAGYDHVVLAQLWGPMIDLPDGIPMFSHDLQQELRRLGLRRADLPAQDGGLHNALADAHHLYRQFQAVMVAASQPAFGANTAGVHSELRVAHDEQYPHITVRDGVRTLVDGTILPDYLKNRFPSLFDGLANPYLIGGDL